MTTKKADEKPDTEKEVGASKSDNNIRSSKGEPSLPPSEMSGKRLTDWQEISLLETGTIRNAQSGCNDGVAKKLYLVEPAEWMGNEVDFAHLEFESFKKTEITPDLENEMAEKAIEKWFGHAWSYMKEKEKQNAFNYFKPVVREVFRQLRGDKGQQ